MKFLIDENISWRVLRLLAGSFPESIHVDEVGLGGDTDDRRIWKYAADHGYTILTKDRDFNDLALLQPPPPKVVWLQLGNASTAEIADTVIERCADIERFSSSEHESVLIVTRAPTA